MFTTYETLQSTISRWVGGSSDTAFPDAVRDAIALAESEMNRGLRVPEMIKRASVSVDSKYANLPDDFLELLAVWRIDDDEEIPLARQPMNNIAACSRLRGPPIYYGLSGLQIRFAPPATEDFTARLSYYASLPALADGGAACLAVLQRYPMLYLYGALANLEGYLVDDARIATWRSQFGQHMAAANVGGSVRRGSAYAA
jgi:hypothetical protein